MAQKLCFFKSLIAFRTPCSFVGVEKKVYWQALFKSSEYLDFEAINCCFIFFAIEVKGLLNKFAIDFNAVIVVLSNSKEVT